MAARVSEQERIEQINAKPNIRFVRWDGEFKGNRSEAVCRCEIDGYEWSAILKNMFAGSGCPQCSGKRTWTADERIEHINAKPNIRFVRWDGEFKGNKTKAVCRCDVDGYEWSAKVNYLINESIGCPQCSGKRKWTADERIDQINARPSIKFVRWDGLFKGSKSKAVCRCEIDGYEWSATINGVVHKGTGCPQCTGTRKWTAGEYIDRINALPNIRFVRWDGEFEGNKTKAVCRCDIDGYEWSVRVNDLVNNGTGCPYCARYGKTEEQPAPNVTVEIPTDVKPAFDLLNW